jgi:hypothetical protein
MNTLASALEKRGASPAQCNAGDASPEVLRATTALYDAVHDYAKAVVDAAFDSPEGRATVAILLAPIAKRKIAHRREK